MQLNNTPLATLSMSLRRRLQARSTTLARRFCHLAILALGLGGSLSGTASQADAEKWYQVEVIVFKRLNAPNTAPSAGQPRPTFPQPLFAVAPHALREAKPMLFEQALYLNQAGALNGLAPDLALIEPAAQDPGTIFKFASFAQGPQYRGLVAAHAQQRLQALQQNTTGPVDETLANPQTLAIQAVLSQESFAFRAVADTERNLAGAAQSIRRSKDYRMLLHQSWTQPIAAQSTAILLQGGDQFGDQFELEGTLAVRRSRFLHVATDLWLTRFETTGSGQGRFQDHPMAEAYPALMLAADRGQNHEPGYRYHMAQQRRLRSNEVHYLDHPQFGIIIEIRPATAGPAL